MEVDVDLHFLPKTNNLTEAGHDSLCIISAPEKDDEVRLVAESVGNFCISYPDERVAVLVPWNKDADQISCELSDRNIPHFKISGTDLFTTCQAQLLFAHLKVVYMDSQNGLLIVPIYNLSLSYNTQKIKKQSIYFTSFFRIS